MGLEDSEKYYAGRNMNITDKILFPIFIFPIIEKQYFSVSLCFPVVKDYSSKSWMIKILLIKGENI